MSIRLYKLESLFTVMIDSCCDAQVLSFQVPIKHIEPTGKTFVELEEAMRIGECG